MLSRIYFDEPTACPWYSPGMRLLWIFSLAFLSGMDGFLIFAPYLIAIVVLGHLLAWRKSTAASRGSAVRAIQTQPIVSPAFALAGAA